MGTVWAATHVVTQARFALKLLDAHVGARAERRARFVAEARAASAIEHPNVIRVHDVFDLDDGTSVMVLDLLEGESLAARLSREERLSVDATCEIMRPVVDAVRAAHRQGVIHRDLKPDNVFLERRADGTETPRVLDFGIAKLLDEEPGAWVTGTGTMLGTAGYMSPEEGFGEQGLDGRADVWSLGVMLYECLSGMRPIEGQNLGQYLKRLLSDAITPLPVLEPEVPVDLARLIARMLVVDRNERLADLGEVSRALEAVLTADDASEQDDRDDSRSAPGSGQSEVGASPGSDPTPRPPSARFLWVAAVCSVVALGALWGAVGPAASTRAPSLDSAAPRAASTVPWVGPPRASVPRPEVTTAAATSAARAPSALRPVASTSPPARETPSVTRAVSPPSASPGGAGGLVEEPPF